MAFGDRVAPAPDATPAAWLASRLGPFGTVGGLVPRGFEAYVRVEHGDGDDGLVDAIASVGVGHTSSPSGWFAVWDGYGWATGTRVHAVGPGGASSAERRRLAEDDRRRAE